MVRSALIALVLLPVLMMIELPSGSASANQDLFRRDACDYGIFFMHKPLRRQEASPQGMTAIAEATVDRYAVRNRFIATCTETPVPPLEATETSLVAGLKTLARTQGLRIIRVSAEAIEGLGWVGRMRARRQEGAYDMAYEIRRYTGPKGVFDVWSGAEARAYPTPDAIGFLLLVYRGNKFVNPGDKHIPECGDGTDGPKARFIN